MGIKELPPARPGVGRFAILVVKWDVFKAVEPLLPELQIGLDFARLRTCWHPGDYITRDTLHVSTTTMENIISSGYEKHVIKLSDALKVLR